MIVRETIKKLNSLSEEDKDKQLCAIIGLQIGEVKDFYNSDTVSFIRRDDLVMIKFE